MVTMFQVATFCRLAVPSRQVKASAVTLGLTIIVPPVVPVFGTLSNVVGDTLGLFTAGKGFVLKINASNSVQFSNVAMPKLVTFPSKVTDFKLSHQ